MTPEPSIAVPLPTAPALALLALVAACGGGEPAPPSGEDAAGGPPADTAAEAGSGAESRVELPEILRRSSDRGPGGELLLLDALPPAEDTSRTSVPNRHDPSVTDTVVTYGWDGLELEVYRVTRSGKEILRTARVTEDGYVTTDGVRVGMGRERLRELRGAPERVEEGEWIYEIFDGPDDPTATLLKVAFDGDRVSRLVWSYYID